MFVTTAWTTPVCLEDMSPFTHKDNNLALASSESTAASRHLTLWQTAEPRLCTNMNVSIWIIYSLNSISPLYTVAVRIWESDILSIKDLSYLQFLTKSCNLFNFIAVSHFVRVGVTFLLRRWMSQSETHLHFRGLGWFVVVWSHGWKSAPHSLPVLDNPAVFFPPLSSTCPSRRTSLLPLSLSFSVTFSLENI